jgi:hypothetical protein
VPSENPFGNFDIDIVFRLAPIGGLTLIEAPLISKLKAFIFMASGPISNVLIIFVAASLWPHSSLKAILAAVIVCEVGQVIHSLIPRSTVYEGVEVPRDGKLLLQIFLKRFWASGGMQHFRRRRLSAATRKYRCHISLTKEDRSRSAPIKSRHIPTRSPK